MKNDIFNLRAVVMACLLMLGLTAFAQNTANGTVTDAANGEPIIGASILEIGTTNGTITDFDGNFELKVQPGAKLSISYMGYKTQELVAAPNMVVHLGEDAAEDGYVTHSNVGSIGEVDGRGNQLGDITSGTVRNLGIVSALSGTSASGVVTRSDRPGARAVCGPA